MSAGLLLVTLSLFQIKHYLGDFHWQTRWMAETKGQYGHPGGLAHSGLHGLLSLCVLLVVAYQMPALVGLLVIAEVIVHYHIDWFKSRLIVRDRLDERDSSFWNLFGLDQAAHQLTYIAMVTVLVVAAN